MVSPQSALVRAWQRGGAGTSQITATLSGVVSPAQTVTVKAVTLQSIAVSPTIKLLIRRDAAVHATGIYSDGSTKNITTSVSWASSNPGVASIGANTGLATGVAAGTSQITAAIVNTSSPGQTLTVNAITLQSIVVAPANPSISEYKPSSSLQRAVTVTVATKT